MTHAEFTMWLDGFLTGKLSPDDHEAVMKKAREVRPDFTPNPYSAPKTPIAPTEGPWPPYVGDPPMWPTFSPPSPWLQQPYPYTTCGSAGTS